MNKKIAIFHNFMDNIGGAEMVTLFLSRGLNADIYTTNIDMDKIEKMGFKDLKQRVFSIGTVPKNSPFKQQFALWKFRRFNLKNKYDLYIISGDWAISGAVKNHPNIWYTHSSLNEIWGLKKYIKEEFLSFWQKPIFDLWVILNRYLIKKYIVSVDKWVCNSLFTKKRIAEIYNKEAVIINPPIDFKNYFFKENKNYWLSVNRLTRHKRIEIQLKSFSKLPNEKLIIVGSYEKESKQFLKYKKYLESIKPENVEIRNWVDKKELVELYSCCKGFITTSKNEDFGMSAVEAMASGKPVIAPNEGGYKETVSENTGILIKNINEKSLIEAIKKIDLEIKSGSNKYKEECIQNTKKFDLGFFINKINKI